MQWSCSCEAIGAALPKSSNAQRQPGPECSFASANPSITPARGECNSDLEVPNIGVKREDSFIFGSARCHPPGPAVLCQFSPVTRTFTSRWRMREFATKRRRAPGSHSTPICRSGNGERIGTFRLRRGGTSCFLPANPRRHDLPVRVVLGCKLPPSLVGVGDAAHLRRQRH